MVSEEYEGPVLTDAQRDWLRDPEASSVEQGSSHERAMSSRIRRRVRNSVIDFRTVNGHLSKEDRRALFTPDANDERGMDLFVNGLVGMLQFVYEGCYYADPDIYMDFETLLETAVEVVERDRRDGMVNAHAELDLYVEEKYNLEEALSKFVDEDNLTVEEIGALLATGTVETPEDVEALAELAREKGVVEATLPTLAREELDRLQNGDES